MEQYQNFIQTGDKNAISGWLSQIDGTYVGGTQTITDQLYSAILDLYGKRFGPREMGEVVTPYLHFFETGEKSDLDRLLVILDTLYTNGNPAIPDDFYNDLEEEYKIRFGDRDVVVRLQEGTDPDEVKVPLPIAMMSLDKIKKHEPHLLKNWVKNNPGPYEVMDKVDGNPGLYEVKVTPQGAKVRLFKRGDGTKGPEISQILPYLKLPVLPFDVHVKGEMVINKKDYAPHQGDGPDQYKTNLSMVGGLTNSKNTNPNPAHLKLIKFIAFDLSFPNNPEVSLTMTQTLETLAKYGFQIPFHMVTPGLTIEWLGQLYARQCKHQTYNVDGLVVVSNRPVKYEERMIRDRNPRYAFGYKEYGTVYETKVTHILWEASKHGVLTPVVWVEEVKLPEGKTIRHPTGHNAKFLQTHGIGVGATVQVIMNTIPKIIGTAPEGQVEPGLPDPVKYPADSWEWNETGVEIVLKNKDTDEVKIARLYEFFKKDKINALGWGEKKVIALYNAGFNTLKKILEADKDTFMAAGVEGMGEKGIENLVKSRDYALSEASIPALMAGTATFDHGMGKRMIQKVLDVYPNLLTMNPPPSVEDITAIEGFGDKTAPLFVAGLPRFKAVLADIPVLQKAIKGEIQAAAPAPKKGKPKVDKVAAVAAVGQATGETLQGKLVIFTGFRDHGGILEGGIKAQGGSVKGSGGVTKKVNYVIAEGAKGQNSRKAKDGHKNGIPVMSLGEFKGRFGLQ